MSDQRLVLGSLAHLSIPELKVFEVLAKVDTGAFSGALHCTDIHVERHGKQPILHFTPLGEDDLATHTTDFKEIVVRSANGHEDIRFIIPIEIQIQGKSYPTTIGLSDRTVMRREMLLGRRFLLEHNVLVDVMLSKDEDNEAERIEE